MVNRRGVYRFIFAGGGTGGHLFPAVAVAEQIKKMKPESKIMFVGTKDKIEARIVPKLGFDFNTIWISGFSREFTIKNILFPVKLIVSMLQSLLICLKYKPQVAVGSGAYVSGPVVWAASFLGAKVVLLEQNSYPGITNRILEKKADQIHLCFENSKKYFRDQKKLKVTGNPVRLEMELIEKNKALNKFNLDPDKKTVLVIGGSLGAKSINEALKNNLNKFVKNNLQIIWQTGIGYFDEYKSFESNSVRVLPFIDNMIGAYSAADLVIARSGATTIAEVSYLGLPVIFVPSTNVAANHQFKNAQALLENEAALLIPDNELNEKLFPEVQNLLNDESKLKKLSSNIKNFSKPDAAKEIAEEVIKLAEITVV